MEKSKHFYKNLHRVIFDYICSKEMKEKKKKKKKQKKKKISNTVNCV